MKRLSLLLLFTACTPVEAPVPFGPPARSLARIDGPAAAPTLETTITSGPAPRTSVEPSTFTFVSDEPTATFECSLDGLAFAGCVTPLSLVGLSEAPHSLLVRAIDTAGGRDPSPASWAWTLDRTPPDGRLETRPPAVSASPSALFVQAANEPVTWACAMDGAPLGPCPPDVVFTALAEGPHTFTSRATDLAGNVDATPTLAGWVIDLTSPDTGFLAQPPASTSATTASFSLWSNDAPVTFECRLDGTPWTACTSPVALTGLPDGTHTFEARAKDAAGNVDGSPAARTWVVDTTGPSVRLTSAPAPSINVTSASFFFEASEAPVTWQCSLDGAAFAGCVPLVTRSGLAEGSHTFAVRAADPLGNLTTPPATHSFTIDRTAPGTSFTSTPLNGSTGAVSFSFASTEPGTFECSLDGAEFGTPPVFVPCGSPRAFTGLTPGSHTFRVRARDLAGNPDATEAVHTWTVGAAAGAGAWLLRSAQGFAYHPAAWDSTRSQVATFGGGTPAALWHWDGAALSRAGGTQPEARQNGAMVHDVARARLVLFGGYGPFSWRADTWEWSGAAWLQRTPPVAPSARAAHAMAYDEVRQRVVLFGGSASGVDMADTWEWDGSTWTERVVAGPSARRSHTMAWDPVRQRVVLFAGENSTGTLRDTWEWDGAAWALRHSSGPRRFAHAMAWDGTSARMIVFGGFDSGNLQDTWAWNGTTWTALGIAGPSARREAALAWDPVRSRLVLIGGYASSELEDVWEFDGTWTRRTSPGAPLRRYDHAMAFDSARGRTVLFGGSAQQGNDPLGDTWEWNGVGWNQRLVTGPSARQHHAMTFDPVRAVTLLFGGLEDWPSLARYKGDTWTWNGAAWVQLAVAGPAPRHSHALVWDSTRARAVLFGGRDGYGIFDDTWEWDGLAWTKRALSVSPAPRFSHQLGFDPVRQRVVLTGGVGYRGQVFQDTWEYDGSAWTRTGADGPSVLFDAAMAWDGARGQLVMMGGHTPRTQFETTWAWNGTTWSATTATGPGSRIGHAMVWDSTRARIVLFGYDVTGVVAQTWEYF